MSSQERMRAKLLQSGIPAKEIKVYGAQIMVTAFSLTAAQKWHSLLGNFCGTVRSGESYDYSVVNKNTVLAPSTIKVWRVWGTL